MYVASARAQLQAGTAGNRVEAPRSYREANPMAGTSNLRKTPIALTPLPVLSGMSLPSSHAERLHDRSPSAFA